jgi:hypothetical protein
MHTRDSSGGVSRLHVKPFERSPPQLDPGGLAVVMTGVV